MSSLFAKFNGAIIGGLLKNVSVSESQVDMNYGNITSVADPINDYDAANKRYVDNQLTQSVRYVTTTLSGSGNYVQINNQLYGSCHITITPVNEGGPTAVFSISKNHRSKTMTGGNRLSHYAGFNSPNEILTIRWQADQGIELAKIGGTQYDGVYVIKIL